MEIDDLVIALEKTLSLLRESESALYGSYSVEEVIRQLEDELDKRKSHGWLTLHASDFFLHQLALFKKFQLTIVGEKNFLR